MSHLSARVWDVCSTRYSFLTRQEERPCVPVPKGTGEHQALGRLPGFCPVSPNVPGTQR